jgi:hypothetical protein
VNPASTSHGIAAVNDGLREFWNNWTAVLPHEARPEAQRIFKGLVGRAFSPACHSRRSNLCSDGTPIEFSLALDSLGRFAIRFVCDIWDENLEDAEAGSAMLEFGSIAASRDWSCWPTLESLHHLHLQGAPASSRFKMWHGAGFSPGLPRVAKFYFNTEWRSQDETRDILASLLSSEEVAELSDSTFHRLKHWAGVGYDCSQTGIGKVKAYARFAEFRLDEMLPEVTRHCARQSEAFCDLANLITDGNPFAGTSNCMASVGFFPRHRFHEFKAYVPFEAWGIHQFSEITPMMQRVMARWGIDGGLALASNGPGGFAPTLLSFGVDDTRETVSLYFRPAFAHALLEVPEQTFPARPGGANSR